MEILHGTQDVPWMIFVYGVPGIGKSTLCASAPKPLFLDLEGGIARIPCSKTTRIETLAHVKEALNMAYKSDFSTIVIDTVDGLEDLVRRAVLVDNKWTTLETPGFGKGHGVFAERMNDMLTGIESFKAKGKNVIFVGHDQIKSHAAPDAEAYDRYQPKLAKNVVGMFISRCDAVIFAQNEHVAKADRTNEDRVRGVGTGKRLLRCSETPAWIAKNRFGLPHTLEMTPEFFNLLK